MLIDWVSCTVNKGAAAVTEWIKRSLPEPWIALDFAPGRYTRTLRCGSVSILTDAPNTESIHLLISGRGCRELEKAGLAMDWPGFIARLLRVEANFTRLDAAIDDQQRVLSMDKIIGCCREGRVVCRYGKILPTEERHDTTGAVIGQMVAFGKRSSDTSIRIYDKALERGVSGHWVRVEMRCLNAKAQVLAEAVAAGGGDVVPGILLGCLNFKERGTSSRRERWPTTDWWTQFLGTNERFRLEVAPRSGSLEKRYNWLIRQVSCVFATVHDSGQHETLIEDMLSRGRQKRDGEPIRATRKRQGPPPFIVEAANTPGTASITSGAAAEV